MKDSFNFQDLTPNPASSRWSPRLKSALLLSFLLANYTCTWLGGSGPEENSRAVSLFREGQFQSAAAAFQKEIDQGKAPLRWHLYLGVSLINLGRAGDALPLLKYFTTHAPESPEGWLNLGISFFLLRDFDSAVDHLELSLEKDRRQPQAHKVLGRTFVALERWDRAEAAFLRAGELDSNDFEPAYLLGRLYQSTGRLKPAAAQFRRALEINPASARSLACLGAVSYALDEPAQAAELLRKSVELNQKLAGADFTPHLEYGIFLQRTGYLEQSVEQLRTAVRLAPSVAEASFELARSLYRLGRLEESRTTLEEALFSNRENAQLHFLLGRVCYEQGDEPCGARHTALSERHRSKPPR